MTALLPARRHTFRVVAAFVSVALLLPFVITALMLWSFVGRSSAMSSVPVAMVNDDQAVQVGEGDSARTIAAGRQLAANLTNPASPGEYDLDWVLTDPDDAAGGLEDGRYYAVMTIPESFSAAITSTSGDAPTQATITVESNDSANRLTGTITEQVATAAADDLGAQASASYLDNLYLGFNTIAEQMTTAASSATELSSGATQLASSTAAVNSGAESLDQSMRSLQQGADSVASGASALADGASAVADGASQTATGASAAATASTAVARGASAASEGAERLTASGRVLAESASSLADSCPTSAGIAYCAQVREVTARARAQEAATTGLARVQNEVSSGASNAAAASEAVSAGTAGVYSGAATVAGNAATLDHGAAGVTDGARSAAAGTTELAAGTSALVDGAGAVASGSETLASSLSTGAASVPTYTDTQRETLQTVVTQPILVDAERTHTVGMQAWPAALIAATALWLGAIAASYLRRRTLPLSIVLPPRSAARTAASALSPVIAVSMIQAGAVWLTVVCFGLPASAAAVTAAATLLAGLAFTSIVIALRTLSPRYGVLAAILAFAAQLVCAIGILPIQTAPTFLQTLNPVLPLTAFANALSGSISGDSTASLLASAVALIGWAAVAIAITATVERRRTKGHTSSPAVTLTRRTMEAATYRALGAP